MRSLAFASLIGLASISISTASFAQSAEEILKKAEETQKLLELLQHPQPSVRITALNSMLSSEDLAKREMAYQAGFASMDQTVRSVALKKKFHEISKLPMQISYDGLSSSAAEKLKSSFGVSAVLAVRNFKETNGNFEIDLIGGGYGDGNVTGTQVNFEEDNCSVSSALNDTSQLEGLLVCNGVEVPVKLSLF